LDTKKKGEFPSGEEAEEEEEKEESLLGVDSCGRKLAVRRQELWKTTRVIFLCHRKAMHPLTSHSWTDPILRAELLSLEIQPMLQKSFAESLIFF
jgi:hypothetical protein